MSKHSGRLEKLFNQHKDLLMDYQVMSFGKYDGLEVRKIPTNYIRWLLQLPDLDLNWRDALEIEMVRRE